MSGTQIDYIIGQVVIVVLAVLGYLSNRRAVQGVKSDVGNVHALVERLGGRPAADPYGDRDRPRQVQGQEEHGDG